MPKAAPQKSNVKKQTKPLKSSVVKAAGKNTKITRPANAKNAFGDNSEERGKPKAENSSLPMVSVIDDRTVMKRAQTIMIKCAQIKREKDQGEADYKAYKEELAAIAMSYDLPGFRNGNIGVHVGGYKTKNSFSQKKAKCLMLEHGITAEEIEACYEESDEYLDVRIVNLVL